MSEYAIRALDASTWDAFARLVERHNGCGFGGCWCTWFHSREGRPEGEMGRPWKERLVREGKAHAALVFDGDAAVAWCQYGSRRGGNASLGRGTASLHMCDRSKTLRRSEVGLSHEIGGASVPDRCARDGGVADCVLGGSRFQSAVRPVGRRSSGSGRDAGRCPPPDVDVRAADLHRQRGERARASGRKRHRAEVGHGHGRLDRFRERRRASHPSSLDGLHAALLVDGSRVLVRGSRVRVLDVRRRLHHRHDAGAGSRDSRGRVRLLGRHVQLTRRRLRHRSGAADSPPPHNPPPARGAAIPGP